MYSYLLTVVTPGALNTDLWFTIYLLTDHCDKLTHVLTFFIQFARKGAFRKELFWKCLKRAKILQAHHISGAVFNTSVTTQQSSTWPVRLQGLCMYVICQRFLVE